MIARVLRDHRLLLVLDDFEQNLTAGGGAFLDPPVDDAVTALAEAAETGALLVTCRYPLPGGTGSSSRSPSRRCRRPSCAGCSCGCPPCATWTPVTAAC